MVKALCLIAEKKQANRLGVLSKGMKGEMFVEPDVHKESIQVAVVNGAGAAEGEPRCGSCGVP